MAKSPSELLAPAGPAQLTRITVSYRPITELRLNPRNPRRHTPRQLRQIARSIQSFGFNVPVLIDANANTIAGHGRVLACKLLGWIEVPTISLEHLNAAQASAFMIADNRLTENAQWDERLLGEQLRELSLLDLDFSLEATGFEMGEIDLRIENLSTDRPDDDPGDRLPASSGPPVSRAGDLWKLGRHRVFCGSAVEPASYRVLMGQECAAMVFSDPPYNVPIDGHATGLGAVRHREFAMAAGEMNQAQFTSFLGQACTLFAAASVPGSLHYICMDWRHLGELLAAALPVYRELKNLCVWAKNNAGMGSLYRSQHELVLVFKHGRAAHRNNIQLGQYGRHRSNVWHYPGATSGAGSTDEGNLFALHPTVKPVALVADAILDCSARGEIVLDGFLGSGTTLIAAERTGRRCYGLEIDPLYVDLIVRRWQAFTGDQTYHAVMDCSFDERQRALALSHGN
jgi:DNA modification methylase